MYKTMVETSGDCGYPYSVSEGTCGKVGGAWLIALLVLIVIALFWGFNSHERKADERRLADNLFAINRQVGINTKGVGDLEAFSGRTDARLDAVTNRYGFDIGQLGCATSFNTNAINQLGRYTCYPANGCGCADNGIPRFVEKSTYEQTAAPVVIKRDICG